MDFEQYVEGLRALYHEMNHELRLSPGASDDDLANLEAQLGVSIDPALRAAWRTADGMGRDGPFFARPGFLTSYAFISTKAAAKERAGMRQRAPQYDGYEEPTERDGRIRSGWFGDGWLPFASFGGGTLLLISDGSPSGTGRAGQIIGYVHDPDKIVYISPSFEEFLDASILALDEDSEEHFLDL